MEILYPRISGPFALDQYFGFCFGRSFILLCYLQARGLWDASDHIGGHLRDDFRLACGSAAPRQVRSRRSWRASRSRFAGAGGPWRLSPAQSRPWSNGPRPGIRRTGLCRAHAFSAGAQSLARRHKALRPEPLERRPLDTWHAWRTFCLVVGRRPRLVFLPRTHLSLSRHVHTARHGARLVVLVRYCARLLPLCDVLRVPLACRLASLSVKQG